MTDQDQRRHYHIQNIRHFTGRSGKDGFAATLYRGNFTIAKFTKLATAAASFRFKFFFDDERAKLQEYVNALPPVRFKGRLLAMTVEMYLADLLERSILFRTCKFQTVYRLKNDSRAWRTLPTRFRPGVRTHLARMYGARLDEVLNETFRRQA